MTHPTSDPARRRQALSRLVLEVFRLNGSLLAAGDRLVRGLGLTSARWQVLGAVALAPAPLPVAHVARNMGLTRQSVQRVADDLLAEGLLRTEPNPHHRRAHLLSLTPRGEAAFRDAMARNDLWSDVLTGDLPVEAVEAAGALLRALGERVGDSEEQIDAIAASTRENASA